MTYKYFCEECGEHFDSTLPERDRNGILNEISCPNCGCWCVYLDTPEGAETSIRDMNEYEANQIKWEDEN